jgi:hypothetical protein
VFTNSLFNSLCVRSNRLNYNLQFSRKLQILVDIKKKILKSQLVSTRASIWSVLSIRVYLFHTDVITKRSLEFFNLKSSEWNEMNPGACANKNSFTVNLSREISLPYFHSDNIIYFFLFFDIKEKKVFDRIKWNFTILLLVKSFRRGRYKYGVRYRDVTSKIQKNQSINTLLYCSYKSWFRKDLNW